MFAHSLRLVLPRMTAPAARNRSATTNASRGALAPSSASEPAVVSKRSAVAMLSLMRTGMPCRAAGAFRLALGVELGGDGERVGIGLEHRPDRGPAPVEGVDAREVLLAQGPGRVLAGPHPHF